MITADELDCAFDLHAALCPRCRAADYCPTGLKLTLAAIELRKKEYAQFSR